MFRTTMFVISAMLAAIFSTQLSAQFYYQESHGPQGGLCTAFILTEDGIVLSMKGKWIERSTDGGLNWSVTHTLDQYAQFASLVSTGRGSIYASSVAVEEDTVHDGVFKSTDLGQSPSWIRHFVSWELPSGIYTCILKSKDVVRMRKMLVVK